MVLYRWKSWFSGIHEAAVFTENVDQAPLTVTERNQWKAEARALRAIYYFYLVRTYGPVPLLEKDFPMDTPSDELQLPRNTVDECFDFIVSELKGAQNDGLLDDASTDKVSGYGRIDKAIAQAFIIEALTYRASWLFNGECNYYSDLANTDGTKLFPNKPDEATKRANWQKVINECNTFFSNYGSRYHLMYTNKDGVSVSGPDSEGFSPTESYRRAVRTLFSEMGNNKEMIFYRLDNAAGTMQYDRMPNRSGNTTNYRGGSLLGATQEMVDAYFMSNGESPISGYSADGVTPIINEKSDYVEEGVSTTEYKGTDGTLYAPTGTRMMYVNREPRFYNTVFFNGRQWPVSCNQVLFYNGGNSGVQEGQATLTGYMLFKRFNRSVSLTNPGVASQFRPSIIFRLADFYLMYAEAANEVNPNDARVLKYLNLVRERAGLPDIETLNPAIRGNQELQRAAIQRERQIELATEGQRYFDVRRWMIADKNGEGRQNGYVHGMNVRGESNDKEDFNRIVEASQIVFNRKMYLYPMPDSEMRKTKNLVQNPGW